MRSSIKPQLSHDNRSPLRDLAVTAGLLLATAALAVFLFAFVSKSPFNLALFFMIGVITIARHTNGYFYGIFASFFGVIFINCFFTYPYFQINFTLPDYPFMFVCMLALSCVTSAATSNLKQQGVAIRLHEQQMAEAEKETMRANLLRAVSHDLRTPLTSILGSISAMESCGGSYSQEEYQELIHNIYDDANWLLNMVENLLSVTKIQTDGPRFAKTPEIVDEVVEEAVTRLKKRIPTADIVAELPEEILMLPMDAMMIEQVLINLLENAVFHSGSKQPVHLLVEDLGHDVAFHVIDQGKGLSQEQIAHIFDGACPTAPSSDGQKGIGIGLSICQTIITAHKGSISAKNREKGAEFLFTLPKEEADA